MNVEELREALAHLPVFTHTPVVVQTDFGVWNVERLDYNGRGILIEAGTVSESERITATWEHAREQAERLREREHALLLLVDELLAGRPQSAPYLHSLREALIAGSRFRPEPGEVACHG